MLSNEELLAKTVALYGDILAVHNYGSGIAASMRSFIVTQFAHEGVRAIQKIDEARANERAALNPSTANQSRPALEKKPSAPNPKAAPVIQSRPVGLFTEPQKQQVKPLPIITSPPTPPVKSDEPAAAVEPFTVAELAQIAESSATSISKRFTRARIKAHLEKAGVKFNGADREVKLAALLIATVKAKAA